jgi:Uma2 family endonuclease
MSVQIERRWFSVEEYDRMIKSGILTADERVELIEGEIVKMSPIGELHAACVKRLNAFFNRLVGRDVIIGVQDPVHLNDFSRPQPDVALLKPRDDFYAQAHPTPDDILLIVEVADTTAASDRAVKVPLYARTGIPVVWLVDLQRDLIEIYARPVNGAYQEAREARRGDTLTLESLPVLKFNVDEILG